MALLLECRTCGHEKSTNSTGPYRHCGELAPFYCDICGKPIHKDLLPAVNAGYDYNTYGAQEHSDHGLLCNDCKVVRCHDCGAWIWKRDAVYLGILRMGAPISMRITDYYYYCQGCARNHRR